MIDLSKSPVSSQLNLGPNKKSPIPLTAEDIAWLSWHQPGIAVLPRSPAELLGYLEFERAYDFGTDFGTGFFSPINKVGVGGLNLKDRYLVKIQMESKSESPFPTLFEIGGRIPKEKDRHMNPDHGGSACMFVRGEEYKVIAKGNYCLETYVECLVIPFLYQQSFFEKYCFFPWGAYGHGDVGLAEARNIDNSTAYDKFIEKITKPEYPSPRLLCPCGSMKQVRHCHLKMYEGIRRLRLDISIDDF